MSKNTNKIDSSLINYTAGFVFSILLTITAYIVARDGLFQSWALVYVILGLAVSQLFVQAFFFLHLGEEKKPRLNLMTFIFTLIVVTILVVCTLWIMKNLNYNMMPHEQDEYMLEQNNKSSF